MNFEEAIRLIEDGKKVYRDCWQVGSYWKLGKGIILWTDNTPAKIHLNQIKANDWQIFQQTLSDKEISGPLSGSSYYREDDIKPFIRKIIRGLYLIDFKYGGHITQCGDVQRLKGHILDEVNDLKKFIEAEVGNKLI